MIADSLLLAATLGATLYCYILAGRLRRFCALEGGMGGAIAVLSVQVDEMTAALGKAQGIAGRAERNLAELTERADALANRLELLVASLHDIPVDDGPGFAETPHTRHDTAAHGAGSAQNVQRLVRRRRVQTAGSAL